MTAGRAVKPFAAMKCIVSNPFGGRPGLDLYTRGVQREQILAGTVGEHRKTNQLIDF
jgi:hypothetical protein